MAKKKAPRTAKAPGTAPARKAPVRQPKVEAPAAPQLKPEQLPMVIQASPALVAPVPATTSAPVVSVVPKAQPQPSPLPSAVAPSSTPSAALPVPQGKSALRHFFETSRPPVQIMGGMVMVSLVLHLLLWVLPNLVFPEKPIPIQAISIAVIQQGDILPRPDAATAAPQKENTPAPLSPQHGDGAKRQQAAPRAVPASPVAVKAKETKTGEESDVVTPPSLTPPSETEGTVEEAFESAAPPPRATTKEEGAPIGNPDGLGEEELSRYEQVLAVWIQQHKRTPVMKRGGKAMAVVRVRIRRNGDVVFSRLEQSSGISEVDDAALAMVHAASPVPGVPDGYGGKEFEFLLPVRFKQSEGKAGKR